MAPSVKDNYASQMEAPVTSPADPMANFQSIDTASELRRKLHMMKYQDRRALEAERNRPAAVRFMASSWSTALVTGALVYMLLYLINPSFVAGEVNKALLRWVNELLTDTTRRTELAEAIKRDFEDDLLA